VGKSRVKRKNIRGRMSGGGTGKKLEGDRRFTQGWDLGRASRSESNTIINKEPAK